MSGATANINRRGQLYVISAPSGAGKTSLTHALIERLAPAGREVRFSVSYTTRGPRAGEADGVDYHFVSKRAFEAMIAAGDFLEYARVFEHYYGTAANETERGLAAGADVVLDIDWQGARQVRAAAPDTVSIFIRAPSRGELERRLRDRGAEDDAAIARRLAEADAETARADEYDYQIVNACFERALGELERIFVGRAEPSR